MVFVWHKKEENILIGLIKEAQKECFELNKLSMQEYTETIVHYQKRLNQITTNIIKFQLLKDNIFKFANPQKIILAEKKKLIDLMKETQRQYLEGGKIETVIYTNKMKSYRERLAEIEEKIAGSEVAKIIKEVNKV